MAETTSQFREQRMNKYIRYWEGEEERVVVPAAVRAVDTTRSASNHDGQQQVRRTTTTSRKKSQLLSSTPSRQYKNKITKKPTAIKCNLKVLYVTVAILATTAISTSIRMAIQTATTKENNEDDNRQLHVHAQQHPHFNAASGVSPQQQHPMIRSSQQIQPQEEKSTFDIDIDDGMSSCLLIMDDNHWLNEWLAYHWTTVKLNYVIIAIDGRSKTSPLPILNKWSDNAGIRFELWNDAHFYDNDDGTTSKLNLQEINIQRQQAFLPKCMQALKDRGRTWTMFTDTDEFIAINPRVQRPKNQLLYRPYYYNNNAQQLSRGYILDFIKQEYEMYHRHQKCFSMGRLQFSPDESSQEQVQRNVPTQYLNGYDFMTLRWLHTADDLVGPKNIVDLSKVSWQQIPTHRTHQHRVIPQVCGEAGHAWDRHNSLLQVYHYLGTLQQFNFRDDARLSLKTAGRNTRFQRYMGVGEPKLTDDLRPWLNVFIKEVGGPKEAQRLLEGVGRVGGWPKATAHQNRFAPVPVVIQHYEDQEKEGNSLSRSKSQADNDDDDDYRNNEGGDDDEESSSEDNISNDGSEGEDDNREYDDGDESSSSDGDEDDDTVSVDEEKSEDGENDDDGSLDDGDDNNEGGDDDEESSSEDNNSNDGGESEDDEREDDDEESSSSDGDEEDDTLSLDEEKSEDGDNDDDGSLDDDDHLNAIRKEDSNNNQRARADKEGSHDDGGTKIRKPEDIIYSVARTDRSGAAVADMMLAHAFAYSQNKSYGGACPQEPLQYRNNTELLIKGIGLQDLLLYTCPDSNSSSPSSPVLNRPAYASKNTRLFTSQYLEYLRSLVRYPTPPSQQQQQEEHTVHAVIHIRRGDVSPCGRYANRYLPNSHFVEVLKENVLPRIQSDKTNNKKKKKLSISILSESDAFEPWDDFVDKDDNAKCPTAIVDSKDYDCSLQLHLDTDLVDAWKAMMTADYVILSKSSFSFVPAMLNRDGTIIYTPFMQKKLPSWVTVSDTIMKDTGNNVLDMVHEHCSGKEKEDALYALS